MTDAIQCPLLDDMQQVREHSQSLFTAMRRLRRKLRTCNECEGYENCPILMEFNSEVQAAVQQIMEEWSLDALFS